MTSAPWATRRACTPPRSTTVRPVWRWQSPPLTAGVRVLRSGFINQRKRHWHKLFPDGPPVNAEEAEAGMVKAYGSLDAALTVAGRA